MCNIRNKQFQFSVYTHFKKTQDEEWILRIMFSDIILWISKLIYIRNHLLSFKFAPKWIQREDLTGTGTEMQDRKQHGRMSIMKMEMKNTEMNVTSRLAAVWIQNTDKVLYYIYFLWTIDYGFPETDAKRLSSFTTMVMPGIMHRPIPYKTFLENKQRSTSMLL